MSQPIEIIEIEEPPDDEEVDAHVKNLQKLQQKPGCWRKGAAIVAAVCCWGYLAVVLAGWWVLWYVVDEWWPATLLAFGPRYFLLFPALCLAPIAWFLSFRSLIPLAAGAVCVLWPVMGLCIPWGGIAEGDARSMKIISINMGSGGDFATLRELMATEEPDFVLIQEGGNEDWSNLKAKGWHTKTIKEYTILSRYPILASEPVIPDPNVPWRIVAVWHQTAGPNGEFTLGNVHPASSRDGVEAIIANKLEGVPALNENTQKRRSETAAIKADIEQSDGPILICGDFNSPIESKIYEKNWSSYRNAFSQCGLGYGYTRFSSWHGVRIDHIVSNNRFKFLNCRVGPALGGDHRPVIAEFEYE